MNANSVPRERELRTQIMELAKACPFHQANPEDCPLFPLRAMAASRRRHWINALDEADVRFLARYHEICLKIKTASASDQHACEGQSVTSPGNCSPGPGRRKGIRTASRRPDDAPPRD